MQRYSNCSISFDLSFVWVRVYLFYPSVSLRSCKDCDARGNFYVKNRKKWRIREGFSRAPLRTYSQSLRICFFQMEDVSKEYSLEMILNHEPTEAGRKNRELGIDGQCSGFFAKSLLASRLCGLGLKSECLHIFVSFNRQASGIIPC